MFLRCSDFHQDLEFMQLCYTHAFKFTFVHRQQNNEKLVQSYIFTQSAEQSLSAIASLCFPPQQVTSWTGHNFACDPLYVPPALWWCHLAWIWRKSRAFSAVKITGETRSADYFTSSTGKFDQTLMDEFSDSAHTNVSCNKVCKMVRLMLAVASVRETNCSSVEVTNCAYS